MTVASGCAVLPFQLMCGGQDCAETCFEATMVAPSLGVLTELIATSSHLSQGIQRASAQLISRRRSVIDHYHRVIGPQDRSQDDMDWTTQPTPFSEENSTRSELSQQTVALRDLDLERWRPAASNTTLTSNEAMHEDLVSTPLEDSGMASPGSFSMDDDFASATSSDGGDDEPDMNTPLEYARFHGLCRDHEMDHPLDSALIPLAQEDLSHIADEAEGALFPESLMAGVQDSLNERLGVDKEAASFLMSVLKICKQDESEQIRIDPAILSPKRLKLELPVLANDHEVDMITLRRRHEVKLTSKGIEPFQLTTEKGESLLFSSAEVNDKKRLDSELQNEKLDVGKETVELFRQLRDIASSEEVNYASEAYNAYEVSIKLKIVGAVTDVTQKRKAIRLSPPLLPVTPPYSPPVPASETMQIDMTSTPEDLIAKDAAAIEKELFDCAEATTIPADKPSFYTQEVAAAIEAYTTVPSSSSPLARKRLRNLRVEAPLTPQYHVRSTSEEEPTSKKAKTVQFDLDVTSLLPDLQLNSSDTPSGLARQQLDDLQDVVKRGAESVQQKLQNEQLIEIDTTMRVKVPNLEAVQIRPPWDSCLSSESEETHGHPRLTMLHDTSKELLQDVRKWGGVAKIERSLPWAPFAAYLAKVDLVEQFDDGSLERYLTELRIDDGASDVDVHAMIARSSGSSILPGHESDDEEVEPVVVEEEGIDDERPGVNGPTQEISVGTPPIANSSLLDVLQAKQRGLASSTAAHYQKAALEPSAASRSNWVGSTMMQNDGIAQFMQLRGKTTGVQGANVKASTMASNNTAQSAAQNQAPAAVMVPEAEAHRSQARSPVTIPIPEIMIESNAAIPIIVSSTTMANRQLIRQIHTTLPNLEICERDAVIPATVQQSGRARMEADFTISASTGILTTTLQKLKQRPLPGQMSTSSIRDTIASTAIRYERLLVLVSEGNSTPTEEGAVPRTLDQLDCEALVDLTTWVHSVDSDVQISYVPGGEQELASWLAAAFIQHGSIDGSMRLLQDETMWERWLRVAGLNAYAAQAVLVQLKVPDLDAQGSGSMEVQNRCGAAAFVSMTAEERVERFGAVLGGGRVLRRVSEAIDGGWTAKQQGQLRA